MCIEIFYSSADADEPLRVELEKHLRQLEREQGITGWHHRKLVPGTDCQQAIHEHLLTASVILLLISPDYLNSNDIYQREIQPALQRYREHTAHVIPILLRPVDWPCTPFRTLLALPRDGRAITLWKNRDEAFKDIAREIRMVIEQEQPLLIPPSTVLPAIWNVPFARNPVFTGRNDLLETILQRLHAGKTTAPAQAISGLGGIGKTQAAVEYAYRHEQDYHAILWVRADTEENLVSGYVTIAVLVGLPEKNAQERGVTVEAVKQWLQREQGWLLILDNADKLEVVRDFLPTKHGGHILLTTQAQAMGRLAQRIDVETMREEEGALLLLRRAGRIAQDGSLEQASSADIALAKEITKELGGLPLALDQAGGYVEETGCGLSDYLQHFHRHREALLRQRRGVVADHPEAVATTWSLSFEKVEEKSPAGADLLRCCAYLAPDEIPLELIMQGAKHVGPPLASIAADSYLLDEAIEALRGYSLLQRDGKTVSMHRLVQAVMQDAMRDQERKAWKQRVMQVVGATFPPVEFEWWEHCEQWLPHALICALWVEQEKIVSVEAADVLLQVGRYMHERGKYGEVEQWYQRSLNIRESILGPDHRDVADVLCYLANLSSERGKYAEAEQWYQRSRDIRESILGPDHLDVASVLNNLAILRKVGGKYVEAERFYKRNLDIRERSQGPEHPAVAQALNNLGVLYAEYGNYEEVEPLFRRSLRIREQHLVSEHPDVAQSLGNLANLLTEQGNYEEAERLYQCGLSILERSQGCEHPYVAFVLNGLANLFMKQGRYPQAEERFLRSWDIWKQHLDPEHPQIAYAINNVALLSKVQGKYEKAEQLYQQSLDLFEQRLGPGHPHIRTCAIQYADTLNTQAMLLQAQDSYEEAEFKYQQSLRLLEQHAGSGHYAARVCARNYAKLLHLLTREAEAQELEHRYGLSEEQS